MAKTISELRNQSIQVRDASAAGENTATRVGTVLNDIVGHIEDYENTQSSNNSSQDAKIEAVKSSLNTEIARAKTEESNLSTFIGTERTERQAAVSSEETARIQADNAEKTARQQADNAEQDARIKADNAEKTARENADITLRTMIQTEVSNREKAVAAEAARATLAEQANTQAIADETSRATTEEERLQGEIDNTNDNLNSLDDKVNSRYDFLTDEVARLDITDNKIKADLEAETARADAAEKANAQAITDETARAKAAEEAIEYRTDGISKEINETEEDEIIIEDNSGNKVAKIDSTGANFKNLKSNGRDVITDISDKQDVISDLNTIRDGAADGATAKIEVESLQDKTSEISKETIEIENDSISIEDNNGNVVFYLDKNGLDAKNVKSNGKDVITDISGKQDVITQISEAETDSNEDEITFASDNYDNKTGIGEVYVNINSNGISSKGYFDFSGNSVVKDYTQLFQASIKPSYNNGYKTSPLCIAHFSDIHSAANPLKRIISFAKTYANYIDDVINTGDSMGDHSADFEGNESSYAWYSNTQGSEKILNIIGNHDSALSGNKDGRWQYDWTGYGKVKTYNKFIKPYIANWNVVQPSNADDNGLSYYYKDYTDKKIRLIALDVMYYDDEQEVWFADTLNDAKTKGLSVLVIAHYPPKSYKGFDANYSSIDTNHVYNPASYNTRYTNAASIVQSFIDEGGDFICWLGGHEHTDIFGKLDEHPKQTVILADTAQTKSADNASITESSHIEGTGSQNAFNVVSFDVYSHLIKIFRVGAEYDRRLRKKGTICIDYKNVTVISES